VALQFTYCNISYLKIHTEKLYITHWLIKHSISYKIIHKFCYQNATIFNYERRIRIMGFLTGKTAIITGGGRAVLSNGSCGSIGYGIATAYAKEGANLVITGRNVQKLEDAKEELERLYGIRVLPVQADVSAGADNEAAVQNVVKQAVDTFGRIDVLINNAQASASGVTLADHTTEQFDLAVYSGLYAAFYYMKACYPYLKETKGTVINFASGAGLFGNFGQCAYAAAKEGIRGLTRVAATEWGPDGINVNIVCPLAWTAQLEKFQQAYPDAFKANVKMPPAGHYGNVETEIGRACVQLASPDFKYMSGETITLEGGMGLRP
jgi:NAD(P)-dependent dehydrogenase (short-subunit alcohol dehydrogenase family)